MKRFGIILLFILAFSTLSSGIINAAAYPFVDLNSDGKITSTDVSVLTRHVLGSTSLSTSLTTLADVNKDGKITSTDVALYERYLVGAVDITTTQPTVTITTAPPTTPPTTTKIKGSEVLVIGESFIAMSHEITKNLENSARSAGVIGQNEKFVDNAVSGTKLSGGISPSIPVQYSNAIKSGAIKYVIMDGGGNDCLQSSGGTAPYTKDSPYAKDALTALQNLLNQMNKDGVIKVMYFFYPDPMQDLGGLKGRLDALRPWIQEMVLQQSAPKCYWLDLRPTFAGKYSSYIQSDGIHPTSAGSKAAADAIWSEITKVNFFK